MHWHGTKIDFKANKFPNLQDFSSSPFGDCAQVPSKIKGVPFITSEFVKRAHYLGKAVHAWTINEPKKLSTLGFGCRWNND